MIGRAMLWTPEHRHRRRRCQTAPDSYHQDLPSPRPSLPPSRELHSHHAPGRRSARQACHARAVSHERAPTRRHVRRQMQRASCLQFVVAEADPEAASTIALTALARAPASSLFPILIGHQPCPLQRLSLAYRRSFWAANDSSAVVCHPGAATPKAAIQAGRSRECGGSAQSR